MNSSRKLGWFLMLALTPICSVPAITVNDGSTTNNLSQIFNSSPDSQAESAVNVQVANCPSNCALIAAQTGDNALAYFPLRSAWYATDVAPTSGVYTVSAEFKPVDVANRNRGGVIGWLSLSASNGIIFQVVPEDSFRVALVNFSATNGNDNESLTHLFNTNGANAMGDFTSAWSELGTNYSATNFATFQLAFSAPTTSDLVALTNATAHITAKVFQGTETNDTPTPVSRAIELLSDLPLPTRGNHRIGYYAVWADISSNGSTIGYLDDLAGEGGVGSAANSPPSVSISSPAAGASFTEPANIPIIADATDSDGTVTRVDFFNGATLLGTATNNPFTFTWTNAVAGSYALTARATDNGGGSSTSSPVNVTVNSSTGGPTLTIVPSANSIEISWQTAGYLLQMATNLSSPTWIDVPGTLATNRVTLTLSGGTVFFRLFQQSAPAGPRLTILLSGNSVTVSWPTQITSYQLQSKSDLNAATWTEVATSNNQVTETITGQARFYRLSP